MSWYPYYERYKPSSPRAISHGILPKTQRGDFGKTWWAGKFLSLLASYGWENRLPRGRSYARKGQVADMQEEKSGIFAQVQGSRVEPYGVRIRFKKLTTAQWKQVIKVMSTQAIFAAKLLAGEMPQEIEKAFTKVGLTLFPKSEKEVTLACSCPDWAVPCKHLAAVFYLLAERFDEDPFLLFRLRGMGKEKALAELRKLRGVREVMPAQNQKDAPVHYKPIPLAQCVQNFWRAGEDAQRITVRLTPAPIEIPLIKRLGIPPYWRGKPEEAIDELRFFYKSVAQAVQEVIEQI